MLTKLNYFLNKFILLWFIAFFASTAYNQEINELYSDSKKLLEISYDQALAGNFDESIESTQKSLNYLYRIFLTQTNQRPENRIKNLLNSNRNSLYQIIDFDYNNDEFDYYKSLSKCYESLAAVYYNKNELTASLDYYILAEFTLRYSMTDSVDLEQKIAAAEKIMSIYEVFIGITHELLPTIDSNSQVKYVYASMAMADRSRQQVLQNLIGNATSEKYGYTFIPQSFQNELSIDYLDFEANNSLKTIRKYQGNVLSFFVSDESIYYWIYSENYGVDMGKLHNQGLHSVVQDVKNNIYKNEEKLDIALAKLTNYVAPPSLNNLVHTSDLIIIPHGILNSVPFELIKIYGTNQSIGEKFTVSYAPSLTTLYQLEYNKRLYLAARLNNLKSDATIFDEKMSDSIWYAKYNSVFELFDLNSKYLLDSIVLVGNPIMPEFKEDQDDLPIKLSPREKSDEEVMAISGILRNSVILNSQETETEIKKFMPKASLVHFATHSGSYSDKNEVLKSWIALSPDNSNNGFLTVEELLSGEIAPLRAELVVLSACETSGGQITNSEGTIGLQWALLSAGAFRVIASQWSVPDAATKDLMISFYEHWLHDEDIPTIAQSLKRAKKDMSIKPKYHHPKYWAAFQLIGVR